MFTKNRIGMLLAAAAVCVVFAAKTPAWAGIDFARGVWIGTVGESPSRIDFDQGYFDELRMQGLKIQRGVGDEDFASWYHEGIQVDDGNTFTIVVTATLDVAGRALDIVGQVYPSGRTTGDPLFTFTGRFHR